MQVKTMKKRPLFPVLVILLLSLAAAPLQAGEVRYVFLFIGDGLGLPQRTAAEQYKGQKLLMNELPAQGLTGTEAADRFITGSAAAATAMASGFKTNIGVVGMDSELQPLKTVAEMARDKGLKVGIVSSVSLDQATPAAFYAHVPKRWHYYDIGLALTESGFDYFGGGGFKDPDNSSGNSENFRGNVLELARDNGYTLINSREEFLALESGAGRVLAMHPRLDAAKTLPFALDAGSRDISLAEFTAKGIELLDNEQGFFLMVEAGKIDWACHANDARTAVQETLALDQAVKEAYDFYQQHPEETLIVVTGDHECGGLSLGFAGTGYATNLEILKNQNVSYQKFTNEILAGFKKKNPQPAFAKVKPLISRHIGLKFEADPPDPLALANHELIRIIRAFERSLSNDPVVRSKDPEPYLLYGGEDPLTVTLTRILNQKAGLAWTTFKHTGGPVITSAVGPGAEGFNGAYANTAIALKIISAMGLVAKSRDGERPEEAQAPGR
ncbi:MAG: alkaline phosphatase [Thermodesulfobacteriota bacterium]